MTAPKRATIYLRPKLHKALKLKAVETETTISDLVNDAIVSLFGEDAEDLEAFDKRRNEPAMEFQAFLKQMKRDGDL